MQPVGILPAYRTAARVLFRNLPLLVVYAVVVGGLGSALAQLVSETSVSMYTGGKAASMADKGALVAGEIPRMIFWTFWQGLVGALGASASIYFWFQDAKGGTVSFRESLNYALNRFSRVGRAHLKAFAIVFWGGQLFIPGLLFGLQFAFVDAVATLDEREASPLDRSRVLTRGRRGALARALVPAALWWIGYQLLFGFVLKDAGYLYSTLGGAADHMVNAFMDVVMAQLFVEEVRRRIALADKKKAAAQPPAETPDAAPASGSPAPDGAAG